MRLRGYDYAQAGAYFVTLCAHRRLHLFGEVVGGEMMLSAIGAIVEAEWRQTAVIRPSVELDAYVIMPNHMHGILVIQDDVPGRSPTLHRPSPYAPASPPTTGAAAARKSSSSALKASGLS